VTKGSEGIHMKFKKNRKREFIGSRFQTMAGEINEKILLHNKFKDILADAVSGRA
jgi:hypothetical protein